MWGYLLTQGATQGQPCSRAGAGPTAWLHRQTWLKLYLQFCHRSDSKVTSTPNLIYPLFPQDIILKLLLQDVPNKNPPLPRKRVLSTTGFTFL